MTDRFKLHGPVETVEYYRIHDTLKGTLVGDKMTKSQADQYIAILKEKQKEGESE